jgi:hypothetical protein
MSDDAQVKVLFEKAAGFARLGRLKEAREAYERVTDAEPRLFEAWFNKAICCEGLNDAEGAAECYSRALDLKPNQINATRGLGIMLCKAEHWRRALYWVDKAIRAGDHHPSLPYLRNQCEQAAPLSPLAFVSYSWADRDLVDHLLLPALRSGGVEYFIDRNRIPQSEGMPELRWQIEVGIAQCDAIVVAWSASARSSAYVQGELCSAIAMARHIVVCALDGTDAPAWVRDPVAEVTVPLIPIQDASRLSPAIRQSTVDGDSAREANRHAPTLTEAGWGLSLELVSLKGAVLPNFAIGKYPVTQAQWASVMGTNPSAHPGDDTRPVDSVSWHDAQCFLAKLSAASGKQYRLPSEPEWEYACRAGTRGNWCFGDDENRIHEYAWFMDNTAIGSEPGWAVGTYADGKPFTLETSPYETNSVFTKKPNDWGIFHMHGNVSEWCVDDVDAGSGFKAVRGGGYRNGPRYLRCAARGSQPAGRKEPDVGFRVCREL